MRLWPALIVAPLLALTTVGFGYALVPVACAAGAWMLNLLFVGCFAGSLLATARALSDFRRHREAFLPLVATWSGGFFSLVIAAQWAAQLFISPCTP